MYNPVVRGMAFPSIKTLACVLLLAVAQADAIRPQPDSKPTASDSFLVAVVEGDELLPLARHRNGRWQRVWPEAAEEDVPVPGLDDVPVGWLGEAVPRSWIVWLPGYDRREAKVAAVTRPNRGCGAQPRLVLTASTGPDADSTKYGLAATAPIEVSRLSRLRESDPAWAAVHAFAVRWLDERRDIDFDARASDFDEVDRREVQRLASTDLPTTMAPLYRLSSGDEVTYYFEAFRQVAVSWGAIEHRVYGWLRAGRGGTSLQPLDVASGVGEGHAPHPDDHDYYKLIRDPAGVFRIGNRNLWVMFEAPGEGMWFRLYDVSRQDVRLLVESAGEGC